MRRGFRILDIVIGVVLALLGLIVGGGLLLNIGSLSSIADGCADAGCEPGGLSAILIVSAAVIVFAWAIGFGMFLARAIGKRIGSFWMLIGVVVMIAAFYATAAAVGAWIDSSGLVP